MNYYSGLFTGVIIGLIIGVVLGVWLSYSYEKQTGKTIQEEVDEE